MPKKPVPSNEDKIRAAVNAPASKFVLGEREFEIKDLPYDDYLEFVGLVTPLIDTLINRVKVKNAAHIPGIDLDVKTISAANILEFCGSSLPKMAALICRQTDPSITEEDVKKLAGRPTALANVVMQQMAQNGIIQDFTDFFGQMVKTLQISRMKA